jgi:hypothetical protein
VTLISHPVGRRLEPRRRQAQHDFARCVRPFTRLLSVAVAGLFLWTVILGLGLPPLDATQQSRLLWVGFDSAEVAALALTLWAIYRSRQLAIPAALIAGTLFLCDAWFDVVLSWGTPGWSWSLATAVFLELPFTALLWGSARAMAHAVLARQLAANAHLTNRVHLRQLELYPSERSTDDRRAIVATAAWSGPDAHIRSLGCETTTG